MTTGDAALSEMPITATPAPCQSHRLDDLDTIGMEGHRNQHVIRTGAGHLVDGKRAVLRHGAHRVDSHIGKIGEVAGDRMVDANPKNKDRPGPADGLSRGLHAISVRTGECRLDIADGAFSHIGEEPTKAAFRRQCPKPSRPIRNLEPLTDFVLEHGRRASCPAKPRRLAKRTTPFGRTGGPRQPTRRGDADLVRVVEDVARHFAQLSRKAEKVVRKPVEYRWIPCRAMVPKVSVTLSAPTFRTGVLPADSV